MAWDTLTEGSIVSVEPRKSGLVRKRRSATAQPFSKKKWLIGGGIGTVVLLLVLLGMWVSGVFKVKTNDGTIVLENLPPDAEVLVDGEKVMVTWGRDGKKAEIHVKPGTHKIVVSRDGVAVVGEEVEITDGGRKVLSAKLELARVAPAKEPFDRWFAVGTRWEGKAVFTTWRISGPWWFTVLSREGSKFKGRLVGAGRLDLSIEGTLGEDGTSFRWTNFRETPNIWRPHQEYESFTADGKCLAERTRVDWKATLLDGQGVEGYCEFTVRREGPRKEDEDVWPQPFHPRRADTFPAGKWSIQGEELVQEEFIEDVNNNPRILFGDLGWRDYDFHLKAMRTAGDGGFVVYFDLLRPGKKVTQWCIGTNRETYVNIFEILPTGLNFPPLSERKPRRIVSNRWYDILIKTRGQWIECFLDGESVFKIPHPDRWGGKVGFLCFRMAGRLKDIEVTAPDGQVLWKKGPPELP